MYYTPIMSAAFEAKKNQRAMLYTAGICLLLLLLFIIYKWPVEDVPNVIAQDLIEVNLGNDHEGYGEVQPLIKGEMSPDKSETQTNTAPPHAIDEPVKNVVTDNTEPDKDAARANQSIKPVPVPKPLIDKPIQPVQRNINPQPVVAPAPKPQKPRIVYNGPGHGNGNGANEDNGYRMQGNNPNGHGDNGNPNGNPDSYGNNPGGKPGGPRVVSGDRRVIKYYSFTGDLDKATIYAIIKVSPEGKGSFAGFGKHSTNRNPSYSTAISNYLPNISFDKADHESTVTVQFNFNVN